MTLLFLAMLSSFASGAANEELRRAARRHWEEGLRRFQAGEVLQAREAWALCRQLDPANNDCVSGIKRIDDQREAAREKAAAAKSGKMKKAASLPSKLKPVASFGVPKSIPGARSPESVKYWNAGIAHFQKGDKEGARRAWTQCLKKDPANADCLKGLERLEGRP